ncbi:MAG: hypothetical protein K2K06_11305 [Oscillospiraceae bacterium]|nr:hypothetical protein [Oscillospiraceae bacterium]
MARTNFKFTPQDIAIYLFLENISHKRENEILCDLFENYYQMLVEDYCKSYLQFKQCVLNLLNVYELDNISYHEAELILMEMKHTNFYFDKEFDDINAYFKLIWLQLMYSGISYRKMKLRNLLRDFGYKRRTTLLINHIKQAIDNLNLKIYLRGYVSCDICDISLDDVIVIRLRDKNKF